MNMRFHAGHRRPCFISKSGPWRVAFDSGPARLAVLHPHTRTAIRGTLAFDPETGGLNGAWRFSEPPGSIPGRLALINPEGNIQAHLACAPGPGSLELRLVPRPFVNCRGAFSFAGIIRAKSAAFACRTGLRAGAEVVQMASGPADSGLNDSIFDPERDLLLRFGADSVRIKRAASPANAAVFEVHLKAGTAIEIAVHERYYRARYAPWMRPARLRRWPRAPSGWLSWNSYFDQAGEKENLAEARIGARLLRPFGLDIWSIESWQANSDRQPVRDFHHLTLEPHPRKFQGGMRRLARQIRALGFRPGIWAVPFGTGSRAFYLAHKDWFLHDAQGKPLGNWCGLYVLDPSQPRVRRHMRDLLRAMACNWGYRFFKVDGMAAGPGYSAHFFERPEVRAAFRRRCADPFAACAAAIRAGIGRDGVFLACGGHFSGPEAAYADAARIGGDIVRPDRPPTWEGLLSQARATLAQLFAHGIVWHNDPDTILVSKARARGAARIAATIVALPGQVTFAGDKLLLLPPDRMRLLQQSLPPCRVRPLDLFPVNDLKSVWVLKIARPFAAWDVVSIFNWTGQPVTAAVRFADLGLDEGGRFLVFDFWEHKFRGVFSNLLTARIAPRSNALLAVHPDLGRPQFLSTDRHLTQGATCLSALGWSPARGVLRGATELVAGHTQRLFFHVPAGFFFKAAGARGAQASAALKGRLLALTLRSRKQGRAAWRLHFGRR